MSDRPLTLTQPAFERSRRFVVTNGRPLDVARFRFHFDGAPAGDVARELAKFQNADGGFGHALEPDLRAPESSALATSMAFQILREIGTGYPDEMAGKAVEYLARTCDRGTLTWRIFPASAEQHPHAPWWNQAGLVEGFGRFELNPTAELLGYLYDRRQDAPPELLASLKEKIAAHLSDLTKIEMHDFLCCKRLAETAGLEPGFRATLLAHLARLLDTAASRDPAQWAQYGLRPLQVADRPESPFYAALRDEVQRNLDYEIETQLEDGSWPVNWSWGGSYPDAWPRAALDWAGAFSVDKLLALRRYGRVEGWASSPP